MQSNETVAQKKKRKEIFLHCLAKGREDFLREKAEKKDTVLEDASIEAYAKTLGECRVLGTIKNFDIRLLEESIPISENGFQQRTLFTKGQSLIEKKIEAVFICSFGVSNICYYYYSFFVVRKAGIRSRGALQ